MTWEEFREGMRMAASLAAEKINQTMDLTALQIRVTSTEKKLTAAYADLGRVSYRHFTTEESHAEAVAAAVAAVTAAMREAEEAKARYAEAKAAAEAEKIARNSAGNAAKPTAAVSAETVSGETAPADAQKPE